MGDFNANLKDFYESTIHSQQFADMFSISLGSETN